MNDTQALFSRLSALAAYFEGGRVRWQTEQVFSARAILAEGRAAAPAERIRAAETEEGGYTPHETLLTLLQRTSAAPGAQDMMQQTAFAPASPNEARAGSFSILRRETPGSAADAEELSRAFCRDARRYDE